jgi:catechol 2,3-dioxygenase-like lactoylglutathione lyase family enzyme
MSRFPVADIRSVELGTPDIAKSEQFYTTAWGLELAARQGSTVYLRATGRDHHVLTLHPHPIAEVFSVTFRIADDEHLERVVSSVLTAGGQLLSAIAPNDGPEGGSAAACKTPEGYVLRFISGDTTRSQPATRRDFPFRLSHVNLNCADGDETRSFFERALGFRLTDRSKTMAFLRCNSDHHAVVLADSGVNGLNHIAFMMPDFDSVMRGAGRMIDHGYPIGWGVGRHGPGDNIFAYFVDPVGFVIEYTTEVLQVDDSYVPRGPDQWIWPKGRTDQWGIAPPKSEAVKQAQLAVRFANAAMKPR